MQIIKCPHCNWEYLPDEIFVKGELIGKSKNIIRDPLGKILYREGEEPQFEERYFCDNCNEEFMISASVDFRSSEKPEETNFKKEYVSLLD